MKKWNIEEISDMQAESGVIGTLIKHPDFITHSDFLKENHFYNVENGCLYLVISSLYNEGITNIDQFNILAKIESLLKVKAVLGKYNIKDTSEFIRLFDHAARETIQEYMSLAKKVTTLAFKRKMVSAAEDISSMCFDDSLSLEKLAARSYSKLDGLTTSFICDEEVATLGKSVNDIWQKILSKRNRDGTFGIPSKFSELNRYFTYERGELVVVQARYKRGKSVFLMNEAIDKAKKKIPVLVIDSEMGDEQFTQRLISNLSGIDVKAVKTGFNESENRPLTDEENKKIAVALKWIESAPLVHLYMPVVDLDKVFSICKMLKNTMGLSFVVYDYLKSNEKDTGENYNMLGAMTDFLKNRIAGELNLAVLAACQLNRNGEVADSDKINRYLTVALKWEFKSATQISTDGIKCGNAYAKIDVNRIGEQMQPDDENDYIDFIFDGNKMTITQAEQHYRDSVF